MCRGSICHGGVTRARAAVVGILLRGRWSVDALGGGSLMEEEEEEEEGFVGKESAGMAVGFGDGLLELGIMVVMAGRMRDGEVFEEGGTR